MASKQRLIEATAELLWERGYSATSPAMIQQRADAGQGSMYHYFKGKADLAATAMQYAATQMRQEVLEATAGHASAIGMLYAYLDLERDPLRGCRLGRLVQDPEVVTEEALRRAVNEFFSWLHQWAADVLRDGQHIGELRGDFDPQQVAALLAATVQGAYVLARAQQDAGIYQLTIDGIKRVLADLAVDPAAGTGTSP